MKASAILKTKLIRAKDRKKPLDKLLQEYDISKKYNWELIKLAKADHLKIENEIEVLIDLAEYFEKIEEKDCAIAESK